MLNQQKQGKDTSTFNRMVIWELDLNLGSRLKYLSDIFRREIGKRSQARPHYRVNTVTRFTRVSRPGANVYFLTTYAVDRGQFLLLFLTPLTTTTASVICPIAKLST